MKVLFIQPAGEAYGSERSMLAILAERALSNSEVVCAENTPLSGKLHEMGIKTHHLEFNKFSFPRRLDWHIAFYRRFRGILARSQPDIVVINLDSNTPLLTFACLRSRIPILRFSRFEFHRPRRLLDRYCWLRCSAVVCPSDHVRQQVIRWAPQEFHRRVHHLYDPHVHVVVSDAQKKIVRDELDLNGANTIGYVGRLHPPKRIETLIRAMAEMRSQGGNVRLLVVGGHDGTGSGAAYERRLRSLSAGLGLTEVVHFLGYRSDVSVVMAACDVIALPSETESLGMVLLEAWSLKIPTVASDVAGCREATLASSGGLLCPVGDHSAMARLLWGLSMQPDLGRKLGEAGQIWVQANCNPDTYLARFHDLMIRLCSSKTATTH